MIIDNSWLEKEVYHKVERPAQYVGGEQNSVLKDWQAAAAHMLFAFPDSYEIGMSHLGMRLIYEAINNHSPHLCERVFMPLMDMANILRQQNIPLFSLESRHELRDFDVIGFTLQYELSYSNILAMLELGGIPLTSAQRGQDYPLIVAGGPCVYNPEPLADVIDLFFIGEGEHVDIELLDLVQQAKQHGWSKTELLTKAALIEGIYVPRFFAAKYDEQGRFCGMEKTVDAPQQMPPRIKKRIIADMDDAVFPEKPLLPNIRPVHDRVMLEVMRGCTRGCRFCQAGVIYRPVREKSPQLLRKQAAAQIEASGYDDISLLSLSTADYGAIEPLMDCLLQDHAPAGVGISLPSLRVDAVSVGLAARTQEVRKSGITLAPEAGSQRMRDVINKGVSEEEIFSAAAAAFSQGYTHIKLYFIIGLPYETDSDILAIAELAQQILRIAKQNKPPEVKKPIRLALGVSSFVPKGQTPFQWQPQNSREEIIRKQDLLRQAIKPMRQVTLSYHDCSTSILEAAFARGDRRLNEVLLKAFAAGCVFDGWKEHFRFDLWQQAFDDCGLTMEQFAQAELAFGNALPWDHIDCGVSQKWLWQENMLAARAELTGDCRWEGCTNCGVCDDGWCNVLKPVPKSNNLPKSKTAAELAEPFRYRLQLAISHPISWLSHLDVLAALEKALRRSALPVAYSQGFNPHMLISWGPAHPVGLLGGSEYVDINFRSQLAEGWQEQLSAAMPTGLSLVQARQIELSEPSLMSAVDYAVYRTEVEECADLAALQAAIGEFLAAEKVEIERISPKGRKIVNVRPGVEKLYLEGRNLICEVWLNRGAAVKMAELLPHLLPGALVDSVERMAMFVSRNGSKERP